MRTLSTMLVPTNDRTRSWAAAARAACWMREISEAKVPIKIRPGAWRKTSSKAASITASDGVQPGRSALVESASRARTPRSPNSASLPKSVGRPSTGVWSNLKSPEWTIRPAGVPIPRPTPSGMEWHTWKNSTVKGPIRASSPACTVWIVALSRPPPRLSLASSKPRVSGVA